MAEHDRLVVHAAALEKTIDAGDSVEICHAFAQLNAELVTHVAKEDAMIYPRLIAGDDTATSAAAREVIDEFRDLGADWTALIDWATREAIAAQRERFC